MFEVWQIDSRLPTSSVSRRTSRDTVAGMTHVCGFSLLRFDFSLRRGRESNPRMKVLQTLALPLRHRAMSNWRFYFSYHQVRSLVYHSEDLKSRNPPLLP